jgi:hypothetical protein
VLQKRKITELIVKIARGRCSARPTVFPYQFPDDYMDWLIMDNVLEHLLQPLKVVKKFTEFVEMNH